MIGVTYLERGQPVTVLARWRVPDRESANTPGVVTWLLPPRPHAPRNVAIRRVDGQTVIRPFRGLRRC